MLWAPIVDSVFWPNFGRRKSWIVPMQYLLGITLLISSQYMTILLGGSESKYLSNVTNNDSSMEEEVKFFIFYKNCQLLVPLRVNSFLMLVH